MDCSYFDAGLCRSCSLLPQPYAAQLSDKERNVRGLLGAHPQIAWLDAVQSRETGFRNKAKMVVGGSTEQPTLGILDAELRGVDLRECGILQPGLRDTMPALAEFITLAGLVPYDVSARRGELKYFLLTESAAHELMLRIVLRSTESLVRIRKHLPWLLSRIPSLKVVSANLLPEHKAVVEGADEIALTQQTALPMAVGDIELSLPPRSFFQTNTEIASALYRQAEEWADAVAPQTVWDLYCGVGGFALHVAAPGRTVTGIESSEEAIGSARAVGVPGAVFEAGDATAFAMASASPPDLVIVNPPRRGIGPELSGWLEASGIETVIYSSCNAVTLARDLEAMPSLEPVEARLMDMFPHTPHYEVIALLTRR